ncbi:MAG: peptidylprolyl isomerase [Oscillospiraceae bacterium]|nr:peptidylprolyl isomerase [Oscillospiraceae bacterium]
MSASSKKKLRKELQAANMTKKQKAEKKEARKLAAYTATFWIVLILCVSIVLGLVLESPINVAIDRYGTAIKVGDHDISTTELTYFYIDAINNWYGQYGAYASYFGLNANAGLEDQFYDEEAKTTWADYFLDLAMNNAKGTYALYDEAKKNGYSLSGDEKSAMDSVYADLKKQADEQDISVNKYLQNIYGESADEKSYKTYYEATVMASAYYSKYAKDLKDSYTPEMLRAFEGDTPYNYNSYTYASFYLNLDNFKLGGTKGADGKVTYTDAELKAAEEYLLKVKDELSKEGIDTIEKLNAAIAEMEDKLEADKAANPVKDDNKKPEDNKTEEKPEDDKTEEKPEDDKTEEKPEDDKSESDKDDKDEDDKKEEEDKHSKATENKDVLYSKVSSLMQEWLRDDARKAGDITALVYETTTTDDDGKETKTLKGYYIVLFQECNDNNYALANVRHLLVKFEGGTTDSTTGKTTYTAEEKKKAKDEAERLLNEWKDGEATEDTFAALANKHSDDGDGTTGGLYEDIYPGQMVTNFNDWCFDEARKTGDTDIVETEYGYHIMYYVSDSEQNYRDYMVTNEKLEKDLTDWQKALTDAIKLEEKDLTRIDKDLVLNGGGASADSHAGHNH